jgi:hypothetical protein
MAEQRRFHPSPGFRHHRGSWPPDLPRADLTSEKAVSRAPADGLKGQTEHASVMPRDPLEIRVVFQLERPAMVPRVFDWRQCPEVAFRIQYDPVPVGSVHEECWHVISNDEHPSLIHK